MTVLLRYRYWAFGVVSASFIIAYAFFLAPPQDFPKGARIEIEQGSTLPEVARQLADARIVAREKVLWLILKAEGAGGRIRAGQYLFEEPQSALTVAYRLQAGAYGIPPLRLTFPEGFTIREMAALIASSSPHISAQAFIAAAKPYEGYLFPDTYLFRTDAGAEEMIGIMRKNFDTKIAPFMPAVRASGRSLSDVITMASLVEKEARTDANRRIVAGILWDRLAIGMPLQVDAVFGYIFDRDTYSPSYADLKVHSPYNTYLHTGLPPGPINNPGLAAIKATLEPTKTPYLYYLTDRNGVMRYARTYAEHQVNETTYLD